MDRGLAKRPDRTPRERTDPDFREPANSSVVQRAGERRLPTAQRGPDTAGGGYQMPSHFHQAKPMVQKMARLARLKVNPVSHQRLRGV